MSSSYLVTEDSLVARLVGELDLQTADLLRNQLERYLTGSGIKNLIFDLSNVSFIDSSGLGVILGRYRRIKDRGGEVVIVSPKPPVNRLLELAGLHKLVRFCDSEEDALGSLQGGERE